MRDLPSCVVSASKPYRRLMREMRLLVVMAVQVSSNCLLRCTSTPRPTPRFKALSRHSTQRLSGSWPPKVLENLPNFIGTATLDRQQTLLILLDLWSPLDRPLVPEKLHRWSGSAGFSATSTVL